MGWARKNEGFRLYFERKDKTYLLVDIPSPQQQKLDRGSCMDGSHSAIGEVMVNNDPDNPKLATTSVAPMHLYKKCRRVSWSDMPEVWQKALAEWIVGDPKDFRGLWKM